MSYGREYIEREVIATVKRNGGFSTFWADANAQRAHVISEMFENGQLIRTGGDYPLILCSIGIQEQDA